MPEMRAIIPLVFKIAFVTLIAVLMILWIVYGVEQVKYLKSMETPPPKNQQHRNPPQATPSPEKKVMERVKALTIFDALLQNIIALLAIIGVILNHKYLLQTSMMLLTIIWLVWHCIRISSDLVYGGTPVMFSAHIIHFFVVVIGLVYIYFVKDSSEEKAPKEKVKTSKVRDFTTNGKKKSEA